MKGEITMKRLICTAFMMMSLLLQAAAPAQAQSGYPIITSTVVNCENKTLTITGTNFGASPAFG